MVRAVATGVLVAAGFALVNGGYIYKTTCPLPSGASSSSWTYGIDDVLPYIRSVSAPCQEHTGTRLALSAMGVAPLHTASKSDRASSATAKADARAAAALGVAEGNIAAEFTRERRLANQIKAQLNSGQVSRQQLLRRYRPLLATTIAAFRRFMTAASAAPAAADSDIQQAQQDLRRWLQLQLKFDGAAASAISGTMTTAELTAMGKGIKKELGTVSADLETRTEVLSPAYPSIRPWLDVLKTGGPQSP